MMVATAASRTAGESPRPDTAHRLVPEPPESFWYSLECRVLGPPLVTGQLAGQRLSRPLALGALSCDGLSSAAYGTEEILYALLPFFGAGRVHPGAPADAAGDVRRAAGGAVLPRGGVGVGDRGLVHGFPLGVGSSRLVPNPLVPDLAVRRG